MFSLKNYPSLSYLLLFTTLFLFVNACNSDNSNNNLYTESATVEKRSESFDANGDVSSNTERKIIKEGSIRFEVSSVKETQSFIKQTVAELDGYVGNENVFNHKDRVEHTMVVRVPEDKFDLLVDKISEIAEKIESKSINSQDVTEEFIDVEARVKTKKDLEARYKELLKKATRVDEILNIEREIGNLRSEIESLEGRLNYLKNRVALSGLTITYYERVSSPFGFFSKFFQALKNGWNYLLWFIIIITSLWPFMLIIIITLVVINIINKKRRGRRTIN